MWVKDVWKVYVCMCAFVCCSVTEKKKEQLSEQHVHY